MTFGTFGKCETLNCAFVGSLYVHKTFDGCTMLLCEDCAIGIRGQEIEEGDRARELQDIQPTQDADVPFWAR